MPRRSPAERLTWNNVPQQKLTGDFDDISVGQVPRRMRKELCVVT
jgi:hypothetical protein